MPSAFILICIYTQHFLESNYIRKLVLYNILLLITQHENLRIYRIYTLHIRDINLYISFVKLNRLLYTAIENIFIPRHCGQIPHRSEKSISPRKWHKRFVNDAKIKKMYVQLRHHLLLLVKLKPHCSPVFRFAIIWNRCCFQVFWARRWFWFRWWRLPSGIWLWRWRPRRWWWWWWFFLWNVTGSYPYLLKTL